MNTISRTITGSIAVTLGLVLIGIGFFAPVALFYGIPVFIVGLFILFNKKEDYIEKVKTKSKGGKK